MKRMLNRINGSSKKWTSPCGSTTMSASPNDSPLADKSSSSADGLRASILHALRLNSLPDTRTTRKGESEEKIVELPSPLTIDGETTFGVIDSAAAATAQEGEGDGGGGGDDGGGGGESEAPPPPPALPSPITVGGETTFDVVSPSNDGRAEDQVARTKAATDPACEMGSKKTDADANVETNANLEVNAREATTPSDEQIRFRDSSRDGRRPSSRTKLHKEGRDADTASFSSTMTLNGGERQWLKACAKCDMPVIKRLLQDQPELALFDTDINQRYSPLHFAAKRGHAELIHMLVGAFKFDVNKRTGGYTPLHLAAQHGQSKIVDLLINSFQANTEARDYSGRTYRHYERNRLGTRLVTTVELHAMSATDRLGSRLCKTDRLAFGPRNSHRMYAPRDETIEFQRRWSTPLATRSKNSSERPQPNRDRDPLRHRGSVSSMAERAVGSLTPTASPTLPPLQNSWSSHSIQSNASGSSSLSSSSSFTRIGSLRKAGSAAIKNLKLLGSRQTFGGSVEHIPVDDEQDTANRARMALSSSPSPEDSDRLLMPPPAKAPPTRVRPKSSKPSD